VCYAEEGDRPKTGYEKHTRYRAIDLYKKTVEQAEAGAGVQREPRWFAKERSEQRERDPWPQPCSSAQHARKGEVKAKGPMGVLINVFVRMDVAITEDY
jgi:hypothetical protein